MIDRLALLDRMIADAQRLRAELAGQPTPAPAAPADPWLEVLRAASEPPGASGTMILTLERALQFVGAQQGDVRARGRVGRLLRALGWVRWRNTTLQDGGRGYHYRRHVCGPGPAGG